MSVVPAGCPVPTSWVLPRNSIRRRSRWLARPRRRAVSSRASLLLHHLEGRRAQRRARGFDPRKEVADVEATVVIAEEVEVTNLIGAERRRGAEQLRRYVGRRQRRRRHRLGERPTQSAARRDLRLIGEGSRLPRESGKPSGRGISV